MSTATRPVGSGRKRTTKSRAPKPHGKEIHYSGLIFRSRLEARWAIFCDLLDIDYDYEPCYYRVGPTLRYLPDFFLPELDTWLEVKGSIFLDAESMAKCLASVGGPYPIPSRNRPYHPAAKLLLVGDLHAHQFDSTTEHRRPVHTLMVPGSQSRTADLYYAYFDLLEGPGIIVSDSPWKTDTATGVKKARRPDPGYNKSLLDPPPAVLSQVFDADERVLGAYRMASAARFDDSTKKLSESNPVSMLKILSRRRSGRPLGSGS